MIDNYYDEEFTLLTETKVNDTYGGKTSTWAEVSGSSFKGLKRVLNSDERIADSAETYTEQLKIYCSSSVPVTRSNKIRGAENDYKVLSVQNKKDHHLEIIVSSK